MMPEEGAGGEDMGPAEAGGEGKGPAEAGGEGKGAAGTPCKA